MNARGVRVHRLATDEKAFRRVIEDVCAKPNGEVLAVEQRIKQFEDKYKMSSSAALRAVELGDLAPSRDVEAWMMALRVRDDLVELKARAR